MAGKFLELAFTPAVLAAQKNYFGRAQNIPPQPARDPLTDDETQFIQSRDSFYIATVTETGWPYMQHRGGQPGFLRVVSPTQLAFADYKGNRQMLSTGNIAANNRVCLFLMDYPQRTRLKILGHARIAVRFEYEFHDATGQCYRANGNENWVFAANGLMQRRFASINDLPITEAERKFRWERPAPAA